MLPRPVGKSSGPLAICFQPRGELGFVDGAGREGERLPHGICFGGVKALAVELEKQNGGGEGCALVAVQKRMIARQAKRIALTPK